MRQVLLLGVAFINVVAALVGIIQKEYQFAMLCLLVAILLFVVEISGKINKIE